MQKLIASIVLAVVVLLAIVQFAPPLLFGKEESHAKACQYRGHRSAAGPQNRIHAIACGPSQAQSA